MVAHELVRVFGGRRVLDGVSLTAAPGRRIGLIGENGAGKSTVLRLLAGVDQPDGGRVERPRDLGFLHQEMPFPASATVAEVVADALADAREDLAALDRLGVLLADAPDDEELLAAYAEQLDQAQRHEAWDADRRAEIVLGGLGLGEVSWDRTLGSLSGGQCRRLALAALVVRRPLALLLDEPTNHLDDAAAAFLEARLRELPGTVVVASHDRAFLDAVCTDLVDLDPAVDGPVRFGGTYSEYVAQKRSDRERWERRHAEEQEELAALRSDLELTAHRVAPNRAMRDSDKMGYGVRANRVQSQISRRVRNTARRLEELERRAVPAPPRPLRFHAELASTADGRAPVQPPATADERARPRQPATADDRPAPPQPRAAADARARPQPPATADDRPARPQPPTTADDRPARPQPPATADDRPARPQPATAADDVLLSLRQVHVPGRLTLDLLDVPEGARLLVTGPNGSGKSTLLLAMAGRLDVTGVRRRSGLRVGLLDQDTAFEHPRRTARATYGRAVGAERAARVPLESLGLLHRWDLGKAVGALSVGQRRRLALAVLVADPPELLLLDEPTNHLSPTLCDELEDALGPGPGAIVVASHDRWLRHRWEGTEVALPQR
ncbi:antibiotic ABC transporter ATP-binding protein [Nocardia sp. NRRL S-836]|nr:antibiotic ABC transporter ATP-binding protein [Nocardia sp. NRRL S-836]